MRLLSLLMDSQPPGGLRNILSVGYCLPSGMYPTTRFTQRSSVSILVNSTGFTSSVPSLSLKEASFFKVLPLTPLILTPVSLSFLRHISRLRFVMSVVVRGARYRSTANEEFRRIWSPTLRHHKPTSLSQTNFVVRYLLCRHPFHSLILTISVMKIDIF